MQYKNSPSGFAALKKRMIQRAIPFSIIAIAGGLTIAHFEENKSENIYILILTILFAIGIMIYAISKAIKNQELIYNSYILTIADNCLSRYQNNFATVNIPFSEITEIIEDNQGLLVKAQNKSSSISISINVDNFDSIKTQLQSLNPITLKAHKNIFERNPIFVALTAIIAMAAVYVSDNKSIIGICGSGLVLFMGYALYEIQTSPVTGRDIKNKSWWILVVIASILSIIYYKVIIS